MDIFSILLSSLDSEHGQQMTVKFVSLVGQAAVRQPKVKRGHVGRDHEVGHEQLN